MIKEKKAVNHDFLSTFAKGLKLIKSFQYTSLSSLTLTEVADINNLSRATARRFILTLESLGYVEQIDKRFSLTSKVLELGTGYLKHFDIKSTVQPYLLEISNTLKVSCSVAILDKTDVVYIARSSNLVPNFMNLNVGTRLPAFATAAGRMLISDYTIDELNRFFEMSEIKSYTYKTLVDKDEFIKEIIKIKDQGYAIVNQELDMSLRAISVPVINNHNQVVMSINLSQHIAEMTFDIIHEVYIPALKEMALKISIKLPN